MAFRGQYDKASIAVAVHLGNERVTDRRFREVTDTRERQVRGGDRLALLREVGEAGQALGGGGLMVDIFPVRPELASACAAGRFLDAVHRTAGAVHATLLRTT